MRTNAEDIIEIGKDLIAIKDKLDDGFFVSWVNSEFEMSKNTAYNFIRVANRFGGGEYNYCTFQPTILYQLAAPSTPESVINQAIEKAESGESVTVADVKRYKAENKALEQRQGLERHR